MYLIRKSGSCRSRLISKTPPGLAQPRAVFLGRRRALGLSSKPPMFQSADQGRSALPVDGFEYSAQAFSERPPYLGVVLRR